MRALWLASAALLTACYPEFHFGEGGAGGDTTATTGRGSGPSTTTSTTSGSGGAGSTTSTTATVTTGTGGDMTSTTTGTGTPPKIVSCGPPMSGMLHPCEDGQVCCYDTNDPAGDACSAPGTCGSNYELACDEASDCPAGQVCCAQFFKVVGIPYFDGSIGCASSCGDPDRPMCKSNADCGGGTTCEPLEDLDPDYGTEYRACW